MQQNLIDEIYDELGMIRVLSKLASYAMINNAKNIRKECYILVFEDMEKRYWHITKLIEKLETKNCHPEHSPDCKH